ncbi:MAG: hypothetical protein V4812_10220 [Pseudomonadota bacterium]
MPPPVSPHVATAAHGAIATPTRAAPLAEPAQALDPATLVVGDNPQYPTLDMRLTEMQARRNGEPFDAKQALAALQQPSAWQADDSVAEQLQLSAEERYDGRSFIRFNALKVETLMPGDTLEIPVQQANGTYRMLVENVEAHGDGSVTWRGTLQDFPKENQVMITQSKGITSGGIFTPDAPYVLQAHGEAGWIASTATLFKGEDTHLQLPPGVSGAPAAPHDHSSHDHGAAN